MLRFAFVTMIAATAAAGCAHEYAYYPAVPGGANAPAVSYRIPPEAPQGDVYVTSFGFTQIDVAANQTANMLHARLVAVNRGNQVWTVNGQAQQVLVPPTQQPLAPAFINSDAGNGPVYTVLPAQRRTFDLYYAVPPPQNDPVQLGFFELSWQVDVAGRPIAQRTPFQRFEDRAVGYYDSYPPYVFVGLGFGVGWWYGPAFGYPYRPIIRSYYYPPYRGRTYGPAWRGVPPGGWRGTPPGGWRGTPGGGGWRGVPGGTGVPRGGGWRGTPGGGGRRR